MHISNFLSRYEFTSFERGCMSWAPIQCDNITQYYYSIYTTILALGLSWTGQQYNLSGCRSHGTKILFRLWRDIFWIICRVLRNNVVGATSSEGTLVSSAQHGDCLF